MSKCPYTWFKSIFSTKSVNGEATELRVSVSRNGETTIDVSLPAKSARWLIKTIPDDVVDKIRNEGIPIDAIQTDLANSEKLVPQKIFTLVEPDRTVSVWLE